MKQKKARLMFSKHRVSKNVSSTEWRAVKTGQIQCVVHL